jgi:hypothetical protein
VGADIDHSIFSSVLFFAQKVCRAIDYSAPLAQVVAMEAELDGKTLEWKMRCTPGTAKAVLLTLDPKIQATIVAEIKRCIRIRWLLAVRPIFPLESPQSIANRSTYALVFLVEFAGMLKSGSCRVAID